MRQDNPIRSHRVTVFCDWLETVPFGEEFDERPEYAFFTDLTEDELVAAEHELVRRYARLAHREDLQALTAQMAGLRALASDNDP
ncbi:hypothetical protein A9D14_00600 [Croceicoccus marinus]|uniref:Uncharacterized protein n=1 Tax=Croceicoccus marinus TaxID=450378 RepID=A0A1Z1F808_9SPHN|nr:hypothetical protein A9D14_00600 [Croceicoccus marinus]